MAGTYNFSAPYVPPDEDNTDWSVTLSLETSSVTEEAAASEAATLLQRMGIRWLRPLARAHGPWKIDRLDFAKYFALTDRSWLTGEQLIRPIFDKAQVAGRSMSVVRFVVAPDGPLAWAHASSDHSSAWSTVERLRSKLAATLATGVTSDDFQQVGLLARDLTIGVARAVYDAAKHPPTDIPPGPADAKRMLADYLDSRLKGDRKEFSSLVKTVADFAVHLQHKTTATYTEAAICATAANALVEIVTLLERERK